MISNTKSILIEEFKAFVVNNILRKISRITDKT